MKNAKHVYLTKIDPDAPLRPVHGVMGGVNQTGNLEMLFYTEEEALPAPAAVLINADGTIVNEDEARQAQQDGATERRFIRNVHTRFQMNETQARRMASWLMTQIEFMAQAKSEARDAQHTSEPRRS